MGEAADDAFDAAMAYEYDREDDDDFDDCGRRYPKREITCKFCDESGFIWNIHNGSWRLFKEGVLHSCRTKPAPVSKTDRPTKPEPTLSPMKALQELYLDYRALARSGDAGNWSLEETEVGIKVLAVFKQHGVVLPP